MHLLVGILKNQIMNAYLEFVEVEKISYIWKNGCEHKEDEKNNQKMWIIHCYCITWEMIINKFKNDVNRYWKSKFGKILPFFSSLSRSIIFIMMWSLNANKNFHELCNKIIFILRNIVFKSHYFRQWTSISIQYYSHQKKNKICVLFKL